MAQEIERGTASAGVDPIAESASINSSVSGHMSDSD
jgi:hypothetical protein